MPAHFVRLLSLVGILFILLGDANEAYAASPYNCTNQQHTFGTSALRIPANAQVGDILYDSTLNFIVPPGEDCVSYYYPQAYESTGLAPGDVCESHSICGTSNPSIGLTLDVEIEDSPSSLYHGSPLDGRVFNLPRDRTRTLVGKARLKLFVKSLPVSSTPIAGPRRVTMMYTSTANYYNQFATFNLGAMPVITSTCNIPVVPTVMLDAVNVNSFSGAGSVSRSAHKRFIIPLQCAGKSGAAQIGVSFSSAYKDASGAPGVIKTDQGTGRASGVGLRIVNETTRQPISFDTLEPGPTPFKTTGTNNFPFSVQYFQTGAKITPGNVTGRVEVSIAYQ